uniref:Protein kinase domain-containing protein n=1 Tax=Ascaris lumbricoides TaxID=6252 RepID=A0A0M3IL78_ASCLU
MSVAVWDTDGQRSVNRDQRPIMNDQCPVFCIPNVSDPSAPKPIPSDSYLHIMNVDRLPSVCDVVISSKDKCYKLLELIGEGGYGCVFRASTSGDEKLVICSPFQELTIH